jgi:predicted DNA-binding antitoxin AbrB/MazE fold protein
MNQNLKSGELKFKSGEQKNIKIRTKSTKSEQFVKLIQNSNKKSKNPYKKIKSWKKNKIWNLNRIKGKTKMKRGPEENWNIENRTTTEQNLGTLNPSLGQAHLS